MNTKLTLRLDDSLIMNAKTYAAKEGRSVSWLSGLRHHCYSGRELGKCLFMPRANLYTSHQHGLQPRYFDNEQLL